MHLFFHFRDADSKNLSQGLTEIWLSKPSAYPFQASFRRSSHFQPLFGRSEPITKKIDWDVGHTHPPFRFPNSSSIPPSGPKN